MSASPDGDRMVIVSFVRPNNTFTCNTTFASASFWEDMKDGIREKLEFQILLYFSIIRENDFIGFHLC